MAALRPTPLLMASVRDAHEAAVALREGADILDVKDPRHGSLGAPPPAVLREVTALRDRSAADGRAVPVSAALGDAAFQPGTFALAAAGAAACGVDFMKIGLREVREESHAIDLVSAVVEAARAVSPSVRVVAGAYAEAVALGCIPPGRLPAVAARAGAHGCLVDTALKDGRTLFDHLDAETVSRFVADCRERGLLCALAGSLGAEHLAVLLEIGPDVIGARGALCEGGRDGRLDPLRVRSWRAALTCGRTGR